MAVLCSFSLNNRETSKFTCSGLGSVEAYSGRNRGRDNPNDVADVGVGAIPPGTYYIVDRQSGGRPGWFHDWAHAHFGSTDHTKWFALWNAHTGDTTMIHGIRRGEFRLHPEGELPMSKGCITVKNPQDFERLQRYLRMFKPDMPVPGSTLMAYGRVDVR